ncbi:MAG TPA: hypothetical protein DHN29_12945 [Cytophagales bacterium]|nr:hypothetical protein [Cytophagales bacterium]|tara:strand:- start:1975 stop:2205 length:231 start_codon:yes stop_codon:yes gene_type:complete
MNRPIDIVFRRRRGDDFYSYVYSIDIVVSDEKLIESVNPHVEFPKALRELADRIERENRQSGLIKKLGVVKYGKDS